MRTRHGYGWRLLALVAALALLATDGAHAAEIELYRPAHRSAAELAPIAEELLAPAGGKALADGASGVLILRGPASEVAETLRALKALDRPLAQYRIESRITAEAALQSQGVEVSAWEQVGDLRVGRVERAGEPGFGVVFRSLGTQDARDVRSMLTVLEGHDAEIWTGSVQPAHLVFHRDRGRGQREIELIPEVAARTGFRVRPRSVGEGRVELEIAPLMEEPGPDGGVRQTGAATRVIVAEGEGVVIGGVQIGSQVLETPISAHDMTTHSSDTVLWVRVSRADSGPRP